MKRQLSLALMALALCGGVQAQTNEQLKQMLDQALKTIDDLKGRVKALEDDKQKARPRRAGRRRLGPARTGARRWSRSARAPKMRRRPMPTRHASRSTGR